ncbi:hypothetical protein ABEF95_003794 [Exophiala dermatitidis]
MANTEQNHSKGLESESPMSTAAASLRARELEEENTSTQANLKRTIEELNQKFDNTICTVPSEDTSKWDNDARIRFITREVLNLNLSHDEHKQQIYPDELQVEATFRKVEKSIAELHSESEVYRPNFYTLMLATQKPVSIPGLESQTAQEDEKKQIRRMLAIQFRKISGFSFHAVSTLID